MKLQFLIVIINIMIVLKSNKLSDPNCRCYIFDSTMHKSGTFKTPSYPKKYYYDLDCLIYRFQGQPTELVKITFSTFNLRKPIQQKCIDYVDVFTTIETVESTSKEAISNQLSNLPEQHQQISRTFSTNLYRPADYRICGDLNDFPQNEFYSVNSVLFLIFHTAPKSVKVKHGQQIGFTGQFTFELKSNYRIIGKLEENTLCNYEFHNVQSLNGTIKHGNFFSPRYPSNYPPKIRCKYMFKADKNERVILTFRSIRLKPIFNEDYTGSLEICNTWNSVHVQHDIISVSEVYQEELKPLIHLCTNLENIQLVSHTPILIMNFVSQNPIFQGQGFHGTYEFVHESQVKPSPFLNDSNQKHVDIVEHQNFEVNQLKSNHLTSLNKSKLLVADAGFTSSRSMQFHEVENSVHSDLMDTQHNSYSNYLLDPKYVQRKLIFSAGPLNHTQGSIHSVNFPEVYPPLITEVYTFIGQLNERVVVNFLYLKLGNSKNCDNINSLMGDRVQLFDGMHTEDPLIIEYCGDKMIFRKKPEMFSISEPYYFHSSGNALTLKFKSDSISRPNELGFKLLYNFEHHPEVQQHDNSEVAKISLNKEEYGASKNISINISDIVRMSRISLILPGLVLFKCK
ncbi:unnamed protein product [Heterobilharzia americana]|nr:unnamed protein product [Heterobilharzia americana]